MGLCNSSSQNRQQSKDDFAQTKQHKQSYNQFELKYKNLNQFQDQYNLKNSEQQVIGSGINGDVKSVTHKKTKKKRVMKSIYIKNLDNQSIQRIEEQIQIYEKIDHPNISKLIEYFEEDGYIFLVQEYFEGITLEEYFKNNNEKLQEEEAAYFMYKILEILDYLQQNKIVHGDIKMSNIIKCDQQIFIIDFDSAQIIKQEPQQTLFEFGTPIYYAPEIVQGCICFKSDIWSCGIMLFIMITGRVPFTSQNLQGIFEQILNGTIQKIIEQDKQLSVLATDFLKATLRQNCKERQNAKSLINHPFIKNGCNQYLKNNN